MNDPRFGSCQAKDLLRQGKDRDSTGFPMLIGPMQSSGVFISCVQACNHVFDVAEGSRLGAVAVDRKVFARSAWRMRLLTTRPSLRAILGP